MKVRERDLAARIVEAEGIRYPAFFPSVYGPPAPETDAIVVNVYRIWTDKEYRRITGKIIGEYLQFDGFALPESGWKQIDRYGDEDVTNEDLVEIQVKMGFPVVAPLPSPRVEDAILNARIAREESGKDLFLEIPTSWTEKEIVAFVEATKGWAWGYGTHSDRPEFLENIIAVVPRSKRLVVLGIHHPAIIPILAALGVDAFSSGAHARYAGKELYITESSIRPLPTMKELPCTCKICSERSVDDLLRNRELLAEHNLLQFIEEVKRTRNAIIEGRLYEYSRRRALTHPDMFKRFKYVVHSGFVLENLPFPKQSSIYLFEDEYRPEIELGKRIAKERDVDIGDLAFTYPFGQTYPPIVSARPAPARVIRAVLKYQWNIDVDASELRWEVKRGIPRKIYKGNEYLGLIRYEDGFFVPSISGAQWLASLLPSPKGRVVVDEDGAEAIGNKHSPLTDHVLDTDPAIRPNMEVIVVDGNDRVLATGKAMLTPREIAEIPHHPVVKVRHRGV